LLVDRFMSGSPRASICSRYNARICLNWFDCITVTLFPKVGRYELLYLQFSWFQLLLLLQRHQPAVRQRTWDCGPLAGGRWRFGTLQPSATTPSSSEHKRQQALYPAPTCWRPPFSGICYYPHIPPTCLCWNCVAAS
jgi:hypothetical protein